MDPIDVSSLFSRPTFGGLATGLDTGAIIEALMSAERRPLELLQARRDTVQQQRTLFQDFNSKLLALRGAAQGLDNRNPTLSGPTVDEELLAFVAASSAEETVSASASGNAVPGQYQIRVDQLASVGREISAGFISDSDPVSLEGQTLSVDYGGDDSIDITVGPGGASLQDLAAAINVDANNDGSVSASVIYVGNQGGNEEYRLVVSGTKTGVANEISVTSNIVGTVETGLEFIDPALEQVAEDAQLQVLGVSVTRDSNDVTDAIPGVTLNLRSVNDPDNAADVVTISVERDDETITASVQALVDAYNDIKQFVNDQASFDETSGQAGLLSGNPTLRSVDLTIQRAVSNRFTFAGNPFESLGQLGIRFGNDGLLSLDAAALSEALAEDPTSVRELLSGFDPGGGEEFVDGAATALVRLLEPIVRSGDGILAQQDAGLVRNIDSMEDQITRLEDRLSIREEVLIRQFTALETTVAQLQSQATFLGQI